MRKLLFLILLCLSFSSFAFEVDGEGNSYRILESQHECGAWGIGEAEARKKAKEMASMLCWGSGSSVMGDFKVYKKCIQLENGTVEHITALARFKCGFQSKEINSELQCKEGEFTCYTSWGNLPYCSQNGRCDYFGNRSCYEPTRRCNTGYSNRDCPPCY